MAKAEPNESNVEEDDDDNTSGNPHPSDGETANDDNAASDNNVDALGTTTSTRKRTTIDESTLSTEELQKLESRRAYNRHCAAKARKRSKTLVAQLQAQVEELTKDKAELKRSNDLMRSQLDLLEQQNRTLLMNQVTAPPSSSQFTGGMFVPGGGLSSASALISMQQNPANVVGALSSGNAMFNNFPSAGLATGAVSDTIGPGSLTGGMGIGSGGGTGYGHLSLLDRLRLQQQLQQQQQLQLQQRQQHHHLEFLGPSSEVNGRASLSDTNDVLLNNGRNNANNNNNGNFSGSKKEY